MAKKRIKFNGDGEEDFGMKGRICFDGVHTDLTLCGITLDGDSYTAGSFAITKEKVNCSQCIQIVKYCKSINKNEIE